MADVVPAGRSLLVVALAPLMIAAAPSATADPDLSITKSGSPNPVQVGSDLTYTLVVTNAGPGDATGVSLVDTVPPQTSFRSASATQGSCSESSGSVRCDLGTVAANASVTVTVVVAPVSPGTIDNSATVSSSSSDSDQSNNTANASVTAEGQACTVTGTWGPDSLTGTSAADVLCGLGGDDTLDGGTGDDVLSGGSGLDTASFASAPHGVTADLGAGTATGEGRDTLGEIENVRGSDHDDVLYGSALPNALSGLGGTDLLFGRDGDDTISGDDGGDYLDGGGGRDALSGGADADTCFTGPGGGTSDCRGNVRLDRNDTRGVFDAARVDLSPSHKLRVRIRTFAPWSILSAWDHGYFIVWLDTRADDRPDYFALIRSDGTRIRGSLRKQLTSGRDQTLSRLRASHPDPRSAVVTIPLSRVAFGSGRAYYRWFVQTAWVDVPCHTTCFDRVDDAGEAPELRP